MLRDVLPDDVLAYYEGLKASSDGRVSDYEGYSEPTLKRMVLAAALRLPGRDVVELGCGPNPVTLFDLVARGRAVAAVDLSPDFCRNARKLAERRGLEVDIRSASAHDTPFESGSFDIAILTEVLEHVPDNLETAVLEEARRLLRPTGHLIVSVPNAVSIFSRYSDWRRGYLEENPEHLREYTPASLTRLLSGVGFSIEQPLRVGALERAGRHPVAWGVDRLGMLIPGRSLKAAFIVRRT